MDASRRAWWYFALGSRVRMQSYIGLSVQAASLLALMESADGLLI
jgi:hypothetical protein